MSAHRTQSVVKSRSITITLFIPMSGNSITSELFGEPEERSSLIIRFLRSLRLLQIRSTYQADLGNKKKCSWSSQVQRAGSLLWQIP